MTPAPGPSTPAEYVASLPEGRRHEIARVRSLVRKHMPAGYQEQFLWGMITWGIPLSRYPHTYNKQPLCYVALASQKNYCSLHLMSCYGHAGQLAALREAFAAEGKRLDMGKSCIRFGAADDLPLAAIGKLIAAIPAEKWIAIYEESRKMTKTGKGKAAAQGRATGAASNRRR